MGKKLHYAILILSLLFISIKTTTAQQYTLVKEIKAKNASMLTDAFGNLYVIEAYRLTLYDADGNKKGVFEDYKSGEIGYVDVVNPMKVLVYFQDFMIAKVLDRNLSELSSLNLNELGFYAVDVIANSNDGNFWLYDKSDFKLKKVNSSGEKLYESENFNVLIEREYNPVQILDYGMQIYLNDPNEGILEFDRFGSYKKLISLKDEKTIQVVRNRILYFENNELHSYNKDTFVEQNMKLPAGETYEFAQLQKDRVYLLTENKVIIYSYTDNKN
ncbi:MAG: hypothetical protein R2836_03115 [Chitinophagales bacterium]